MKLYYSAGSCSTSCHITLEESGLAYEAVEVDWDNPAEPNVALVTRLNPMGTLPILLTDKNGQLDQNLAIHCYVADLAPAKKLLPPAGTPERAQALNWLSFVAADLHKSFSPLFGLASISPDAKVRETVRVWAEGDVKKCLSIMDARLAGKDYLMGKNYTVADAYAFVVTNWTQWLEISIEDYKNLKAYLARVAERPAVRKVYQEEGLLE
jgi:glutathione S-transferase